MLRLVPIYFGHQQELLARLAHTLNEVLGMRVEQHLPRFDPELAFDPNREQYNSRILLGSYSTTPRRKLRGSWVSPAWTCSYPY